MQFSKVDKFILFGGGKLLYKLSIELVKKGFNAIVVTSQRHSIEIITENKSLLDLLKERNIKIVVTDNIETDYVLKEITKTAIGISFGASWIFKKSFIELFNNKLINNHGSRLPQNRGGGGYSWRILMGETRGANLLHFIDEGVDTGKIIKYEEYIYPGMCRKPIDFEKYSIEKNYFFIMEFIEEILSKKTFRVIDQQETFSTYFPRLHTDTHGYIDWNWSIEDIERFICAFDEHYNGAITFWKDFKLRLKDCYITYSDGRFHPFQSGIVYRVTEYGVFIAANEGSLVIKSIKDDNGNNFLSNVKIGDRFYTPIKYLEKAKKYRAIYSSKGLKIEKNADGK